MCAEKPYREPPQLLLASSQTARHRAPLPPRPALPPEAMVVSCGWRLVAWHKCCFLSTHKAVQGLRGGFPQEKFPHVSHGALHSEGSHRCQPTAQGSTTCCPPAADPPAAPCTPNPWTTAPQVPKLPPFPLTAPETKSCQPGASLRGDAGGSQPCFLRIFRHPRQPREGIEQQMHSAAPHPTAFCSRPRCYEH